MIITCVALYFVIGCIFAHGFRRTLEDTGRLLIRLLRVATEFDPDVRMMVAIFAAFASLLWPAFLAAVIAVERAKKKKENVDVHR